MHREGQLEVRQSGATRHLKEALFSTEPGDA